MQIDINTDGPELPDRHRHAGILSDDERALLLSALDVVMESSEGMRRLDLEEESEPDDGDSPEEFDSRDLSEPKTRMRDALTLIYLIEEVAEARKSKTEEIKG